MMRKKNGVSKKKFKGKYIFPYDKGGQSKAEGGWLPKYYVKTGYYINWSIEAVNEMKLLPGFRHDGKEYYFVEGISFSHTGFYSPTFRKSSGTIFDTAGSSLFPKTCKIEELLGLLNSQLFLFLFKSFINHTVNTAEDPLKVIPVIININSGLIMLVNQIITKQKLEPCYDYMTNEQLDIDKLVFEMYNLNEEDIKEVENWYFRRYPKLAKVIEEKLKVKNND